MDNTKKLYDALRNQGYSDLGDYSTFEGRLKDSGNREKLYATLSKDGFDDIGDYDSFEAKLGYSPVETQEEPRSYMKDLGGRLASGALNAVGSSLNAMRKVADVTDIGDNDYINAAGKALIGSMPVIGPLYKGYDAITSISGKSKADILQSATDQVKEKADEYHNASDRYKGKDFMQLAKEEDYRGALGEIFLSATESLPQSLGIAATGGAGLIGTGLVTASDKYDQVMEGQPDMNKGLAVADAVVTGISEAATECFGAGAMGKAVRSILKTGGKEAAGKAIEKSIREKAANFMEKHWLLGPIAEEGMEEMVNAAVEYGVDTLTGVERPDNIMDAVAKAGVYGAAGGMQYTPIVGGARYYSSKKKKNITERFNKSTIAAQDLLGEDFPKFDDTIDRLNLEQLGKFVDNVASVKRLNPDQKDGLIDYINNRSSYNQYVEHVKSRISEEQQRRRDEIDRMSNPDMGAVISVKSNLEEGPVNIVGGRIVFDEAGIVDMDNSDQVLYYLDKEGKRQMATPDKFNSLIDTAPVEQLYTDTIADVQEGVIREEENDIEQDNMQDVPVSFEIGDEVSTAEGVSGIIQQIDEEGNAVISSEDGVFSYPVNKLAGVKENVLNDISDTGEILAEEPTEQQIDPIAEIPRDKKGNFDYEAISDPQMYAVALVSEFEDEALPILDEQIAGIKSELENAESKKNAIERRRISKKANSDIERLKKAREILQPVRENNEMSEIITENEVMPSEEQSKLTESNIKNKTLSSEKDNTINYPQNDLEFAEWALDESDNSDDLLSAYQTSKKIASEEGDRPRWQQELLGKKIKSDSFYRFGDRNKVNGGLAKAWLKKDGLEIDTFADELSEYGVLVTPEDIVSFMLDNPSNYMRKTSDLQNNLAKKWSEYATKEASVPIAGPESATGKVFIAMKRGGEINKAEYETAVEQDMRSDDDKSAKNFLDEWYSELSSEEGNIPPNAANFEASWTEEDYNEIYQTIDNEINNKHDDTEGSRDNSETEEDRIPNERIGEDKQPSGEKAYQRENTAPTEPDREPEGRNTAESTIAEAITEAERQVDINPTEAQKAAGNYRKGHVDVNGFDITIEQPAGSIRSGKDSLGKEWSVTMNNTYGYIRGTEGVDGDHVDVFLGPNQESNNVFVIDQVNSDGIFDEHKVMMGFNTQEDAKAAYLANYENDWKGLGNITGVSLEDFKKWIDSSHRKTKPFADYKIAKDNPIIIINKNEAPANRLVTDERYEELKRRMQKKLKGQMNLGVDPEILAIGTEMAVYHIEKGMRKFSEYAKAMVADLGEVIQPYLKSFYNGARDLPEMNEFVKDMDTYEDVRLTDITKILKGYSGVLDIINDATKEREIEVQLANTKKQKQLSKNKKTVPDTILFPEYGNFDSNKINEDEQKRRSETKNPILGEDTREETRNVQSGRVDHGHAGNNVPDSSGSRGISKPSTGTTEHVDTLPEKKNIRNNRNERGRDYAPTSLKARFDANIAAIRLMRELKERAGTLTPIEMQVLRRYSGWGGLGTFFNNEHTTEGQTLRELLGEEEYEAATMSINSAYYTPASVTDSLWDAAEKLGFKGGTILEGSAGIGNILGAMPESVSDRSEIEAVEIDGMSGNILKLLYPDAKVHVQGFQDTNIKNGSVDLAITNVPFVTGLHVYDKVDKDLSKKFKNIHDFCIAKNIRKLREGGIGIFITSNGTLDKSRTLREWIIGQGKADVVGAFRLNNETFGGTNATSDIIIVQKRIGNQPSAHAIDVLNTSVVRTGEYETGELRWDKKLGRNVKVTKPVAMEYNSYFVLHPENMAGEMAFAYEKGDTFRPGSVGLYPVKGQNQQKLLERWIDGMSPIVGERSIGASEQMAQRMATAEKEGTLLLNKDGELCVSQRGEAVPVGVNKNKVKGYEKSECLGDYNAIKTALDEVLQYQVANEDDGRLKPLLKELNRAYDNFVAKYGPLNRNTSISFLKNDVDFPSISALEDYRETKSIGGEKSISVTKTNVFNGRVIGYKAEPAPTTVKDGVIASVYKFGGIDLGYIADKLDRDQEEVKHEILNERIGFVNPTSGGVEVRYEYLSGNVREKLELAKTNNAEGEYTTNIEELEKVIPMDIPAHLIEFSLGSSWIDPQLYQQFLSDEFGITDSRVEHVEGAWIMNLYAAKSVEKNRQAGVYSEMFDVTIYGDELVGAALNNRAFAVKRIIKNSDGSAETLTDKDATQACTTRIAEIKDSFKEWARGKMQQDEVLAEKMMRTYNDKFNAIVPKSIDDMFLPERFGGAAESVSLYPHQKKSVIRGTTEPLMLAHEVGTGKTFTLISTAMEMRRIGTAKKPMIVVQNATVGQFVSEAKKLYPNASILTLSERDRTPEGRRAFYGKIKYSDWDMIVVPQSTFEMIPDSPESQMTFIRERIDDKMHALEAMREAGADELVIKGMEKELDDLEIEFATVASGESATRKDAKSKAKSADNASVKAREQLDRRTDDVQYFDEMGVDAILVDEAHEYKRLGFATMMTRGVKGIDPAGSKKAAGVYLKTRVVLEQNGWKNVVFATGTPISNTAAELWTFMKYLMPKEVMVANEIYYFDDFVRNFGNISQSLEFATNGKFKENTRFAAYINKPELVRLWASVSDTVLTKEVNYVNDKVPEMESGKAQDVFLPQSDGLIDIMRAVRKRLDEFEQMSGKEKRANSSIPLTMYGIAKRAAIDTRLVDKNAQDDPNSKTNKAVEETLRSLKETESYKGTVAIFCDNQRRWDGKVVGFDLFEDIKCKLVEKGVPQEQIVIMKSGMSIPQKEKIFADVNAGNVRVIIGNTQTLGTGVNIQERLHTLVHMDAPDRPMDYTQRNGRILRQGNLHRPWNKTVRILRFGVEDSLDVTSYQRLKTKAGFIDSIMDGKGALVNNQENRTLEEEEEGLFDNPVAVLSGSQYALLKNQAEREYRKYANKKAQYVADQIYITNRFRRNEGKIKANLRIIEERREQVEQLDRLFPDGIVHEVKIAGKVCRTDAEIDSALRELVNKPIIEKAEAARKNTNYRGEKMVVKLSLDGVDVDAHIRISRESVYDSKVKLFRVVMHKDVSYSCESLGLNDVPVSEGYVRNVLDDLLENVISGRDARESMDTLAGANAKMMEENGLMKERNGKPFGHEKELKAAQDKVEEYTELMRKEMEEKEAKYADRGSSSDIELSEVHDDDIRLRLNEDNIEKSVRLEKLLNSKPIEITGEEYTGKYELERSSAQRYILDNLRGDYLIKDTGEIVTISKKGAKKVTSHSQGDVVHLKSLVAIPQIIENAIFIEERPAYKDGAQYDSYRYYVSGMRINDRDYTVRMTIGVKDGEYYYDHYLSQIEKGKLINSLSKVNQKESLDGFKPTEDEPNPSYANNKDRMLLSILQIDEGKNEEIISEAENLANELNTDINIIQNLDDISDNDTDLQRKKLDAKGWYEPSTGKVYLILPNTDSVGDAQATLLHEVVAHKGLRDLLGGRFDKMMDTVYDNLPEHIKDKIIKSAITHYNMDIRISTEEYLASIAEKGVSEPAVWKKVKSAIKDFFRSMGVRLKISDEDIAYLLWKSKNRLMKGDSLSIIASKIAADFTMKKSLLFRDAALKEGDLLSVNEEERGMLVETMKQVRNGWESNSPAIRKFYERFREGFQDKMLPLRRFQEEVTKITGKAIEDFENAYLNENTLISRSDYEISGYKESVINPLVQEMVRVSKGSETKSVQNYLMVRHGLERNEKMRVDELEKYRRKLEERFSQYKNELEQQFVDWQNSGRYTEKEIARKRRSIDKRINDREDEVNDLLEKRRLRLQGKDYSGLTDLSKELLKSEKMDELGLSKYISEYENQHDTKTLWELLQKANHASLKKLFESGCITKEEMNRLKDMYEFYVPLRGWDSPTAGDLYDYFFKDEKDMINSPIRNAKGRTSKAGDIIANISSMYESAVFMGNKNKMKLQFLNFVRNHKTEKAVVSGQWFRNTGTQSDPFWTAVIPSGLTEDSESNADILDDFEESMKELQRQGLAKMGKEFLKLGVPVKNWQADQHAIRVKEAGRDLVIYINGDPRVAQAINGLNNQTVEIRALKWIDAIKRFMMKNYTTRSVNFIFRNLIRDTLYVNTMNFVKYGAGFEKAYLKNVIPCAAAISRSLKGKKSEKSIDTLYEEFKRNGGQTGFVALRGYEKYKEDIDRLIRKSEKSKMTIGDVFHSIGTFIESANTLMEDTNRFAVYMAAKETGMSITNSINAAKESSVNFNRKGSGAMGGAYANSFYFFFNAGMQGTHNFLSASKQHPLRAAAAMGMWGTLGFAMSIASSLFGDDDDEYNKISDYVRQNNIVLPIPGTSKYILLPLSIELRAMFGTGDMLAQLLRGEYKGRSFSVDIIGKFMDMLPKNFMGDGGNIGQNLIPDAVRPFTDAYWFNENFFGKRVTGRNDFNKNKPEFHKITTGTSSIITKASEYLNEATGGDYATKGWSDGLLTNPSAVEYILEQYMGGVGKLITQSYKTVEGVVNKDVQLRNIPIVSGLSFDAENMIPRNYINERYRGYLDLADKMNTRKKLYMQGIQNGVDVSDRFSSMFTEKEFQIASVAEMYKKQIDSMYTIAEELESADKKAMFAEIENVKKQMLDEIDEIK